MAKKAAKKASSSEPYLGLARKWRPQTFADLVGQEAVAKSLCDSIAAGRLVHGHILAGPRGVGKTTSARILARALNCEDGPIAAPCGKCVHCVEIAAGSDLDVLEIDAASNTGVDKMRDLLERVVLAPFSARYKVYIIDEVHMLSVAAFNALLKTLEEPPPHVIFVFATTELEKIPETVRSRCVIHHFRRLSADDIIRRLAEVAEGEGLKLKKAQAHEVFSLIAQSVDGGMRDALVVLDQLLAMSGDEPDAESVQRLLGLSNHATLASTVEWIAEGNAKALIGLVDDLVSRGRSLERFVKGLMAYLHDVMILQADPRSELVSVTGEALEGTRRFAGELAPESVFNMLNQLFELEEKMRRSTQVRFLTEFTLLRMASVKPLVPIDQIIRRLAALPDSSAEGAAAQPPAKKASATSASPGPASVSTGAASVARFIPHDTGPSPESLPRFSGADSAGGTAGALAFHDSAPSAEPGAQGRPGEAPPGRSLAGLAREELIEALSELLPADHRYLSQYLKIASAMRADEGTLWIQWPKDDRVGSKMLAHPGNNRIVEQSLAQLTGRPMSVRSSFSTEEAPEPSPAAPARIEEPTPVFSDSEPLDIGFSPPGPNKEPAEANFERPASEPVELTSVMETPGPKITSALSLKLLKEESDFSRRAFLVRDFFSGAFVDDSGREVRV